MVKYENNEDQNSYDKACNNKEILNNKKEKIRADETKEDEINLIKLSRIKERRNGIQKR